MKEYGQYCPVARACEILTDRWTLLIVREMLAGIVHFNDLQRGLPGIPRTLLAQRLDWLEQARVVERKRRPDGRTGEYHLTAGGRELQHVVDALGTWGARWAFGDIRPAELDPVLLLWMMRRRIRRRQLTSRRITMEFRFPGARPEFLWLVIDRTDVSVCLKHPGFDPDLRITADLSTFYNAWLGRITLVDARRRGAVRIEGDRALERNFPEMLRWSPMARAVRTAVLDGLPTAVGLGVERRH
jgi:DNA-binding HxlR family transcriptional regulator